jgi:glycosyltransferase involved in cell wall biosynthesis
MAGIGIRYLELARRLPDLGVPIVLLSSGPSQDVPDVPIDPCNVRQFQKEKLGHLVEDCCGALAQGQLANELILEKPDLPIAIDLYDPWLIENLAYSETLGFAPYRQDHNSWILQLSRGDFFLCSSDEQKQFYLGFLTALGRVNPERYLNDPDMTGLIAPVPFGVPDSLPPHRPVLPARSPGEKRFLFGGLYDWYDPWTLLKALEHLDNFDWKLIFIRNPNPESTPQTVLANVQKWCEDKKWWGVKVQLIDWQPAQRRYDLLRDVDALVAPHRVTIETHLSMRTRFLDALAAGCPVITTEGGSMSRLLRERKAGWVVPPEDPLALRQALFEVTEDTNQESREAAAKEIAAQFSWERVLQPLIQFCREPRQDPTKREFAFRPPTVSPPDPFLARLRRRFQKKLGRPDR